MSRGSTRRALSSYLDFIRTSVDQQRLLNLAFLDGVTGDACRRNEKPYYIVNLAIY